MLYHQFSSVAVIVWILIIGTVNTSSPRQLQRTLTRVPVLSKEVQVPIDLECLPFDFSPTVRSNRKDFIINIQEDFIEYAKKKLLSLLRYKKIINSKLEEIAKELPVMHFIIKKFIDISNDVSFQINLIPYNPQEFCNSRFGCITIDALIPHIEVQMHWNIFKSKFWDFKMMIQDLRIYMRPQLIYPRGIHIDLEDISISFKKFEPTQYRKGKLIGKLLNFILNRWHSLTKGNDFIIYMNFLLFIRFKLID